MDKTWSVVKFTGENTVEAVPTSWLLGQLCYWPPYTKEKVIQAIRKQEPPNTCWPLHNIELFRNATYNDYSVARFKCKAAEDHSDLNSEIEDSKLRKVRKKKHISDSSSDESDRYAHPTGGLPLPPSFSDTAHGEDIDVTRTRNNLPVLQQGEKQTENPSVEGTHCCTCLKNDDVLKKIFKQQALIKNIVTDVLEEIKKINMQPVSKDDEEIGSIFLLFENFLINTDEGMKEFETLLEDKKTFDCAVKEFSKIGGSTLYDFIKRCLGQIITNKYADEYSWLGAKKKKIFGSSKLAEVLMVAADKSQLSTDRKATEIAIKNWLRRAKERTLASEKKTEPTV